MTLADRSVGQVLIENKSKFVLVHASSGHKHAVEEILSQPAVQTRLADTKASEEIRALATFFDMLKKDPDRAYYGYNVRTNCFGDYLIGFWQPPPIFCCKCAYVCMCVRGGGCPRRMPV